MRPALLRPDNWTPPARTPWGGRAIAERWKAGLALDPTRCAWPAIGESWELSFDPTFPSRTEDGRALADVIAASPEAWLGPDRDHPERVLALMLKLLDAREPLSVQVHPRDDDPALAPLESGKPEGWVILARAPGAGIHIGLADGVDRVAVERALDHGESAAIAALLNFVPVEPGDAFVIAPGTVHAIGAGVTLLEPQLVRPGRSGVTYRLWDWSRRYDASGRFDPAGALRPLQRERSLAVIDWQAPRGAAFVASARRSARTHEGAPGLPALRGLVGERVLELAGLRLDRWRGEGELVLAPSPTFVAMMVVDGALDFDGGTARRGQTLAVPAAASTGRATLRGEAYIVAPAPGVVAERART